MEKAIRQRLLKNQTLVEVVTHFGEAAIYYAKSPDDVAREINYPQIVLSVDKFTDAAHGIAGLLSVEIICTTATLPPEPIERLVRGSLEGVLFKADEIFLLKWSKSEVFEEPAAERTSLIIGHMVTFEIRELPSALTSTPDPVQSLNEWIAHWDSDVFVIGLSDMGDVYEPTRKCPAVYIDVISAEMIKHTRSTIWMAVELKCHVFAPKVRARREWLTMLSHALMYAKAIPMTDGSPMRLQSSKVNWSEDEIAGQLSLRYEYGIPVREEYTVPINWKNYAFDDKARWQKCTR